MTKKLFAVLIVALALLAVAASFWVTRQVMPCRPMKSLDTLGQVDHFRRELGLDERQVAAIRQLEKELAAKLADRCNRYCAARTALGEAILVCTNSEANTEALIGSICALQTESEKVTFEHIRKVSALLTPDQRKRFITELTQCRCASGCCGRER